jgi:hypothetical protein
LLEGRCAEIDTILLWPLVDRSILLIGILAGFLGRSAGSLTLVARHEQHNFVLVTPFPTVRKVSALRQRMIDDMTVRKLRTQHPSQLPSSGQSFRPHFDKSAERLGPEKIRTCQIYLAKERHAVVGTRSVAVSARGSSTKSR